MSADFFLENRAHQLRRLCIEEPVRFSLNRTGNRGKVPDELAAFYELISRICDDSQAASSGLSAQRREDLRRFEREIVRLRFSADESIKNPAVQLIKAIFSDAEYFSGLKPLPQYTDSFAYERLFPSWLNLLTATMLPQAGGGKPRMNGVQQGALFQFLSKLQLNASDEDQLVGLLTFLASRFDAPLCEDLLQRFSDLFLKEGSSMLTSISSVEAGCKNARQFAARLRQYLTVKHSMYGWPASRRIQIAYARPMVRSLPVSIKSLLQELEQSQDWEHFFHLAEKLSAFINSDELISSEYLALLDQHPQHAGQLIELVIHEAGPPCVVSEEAQHCLAFIFSKEFSESGQIPIEEASRFSNAFTERLRGLQPEALDFLCQHLLAEKEARSSLLGACSSETGQRAISASVLERAGRTQDDSRFLKWLACASVLSPEPEAQAAKQALLAIDGVVQNRSIGNREFSDLVADLRSQPELALGKLASPIRAAGGGNARLAALYMTLNEVAQTLAATGKSDNFSVVRAKYSRLTNLDLDVD